MRRGKDVELAHTRVGSIARGSVWTLGLAEARRQESPGDHSYVSPDPDELFWATVKVRTALQEMTVAAAAAVEGARSMAEVLDDALNVLESTARVSADRSASGEQLQRGGLLSPREREVLAHVAEGRSNKAIAEALFVSPNTIKTHVASLMNKLHADSRAQLAAIAVRQGAHPIRTSTLSEIKTLAS